LLLRQFFQALDARSRGAVFFPATKSRRPASETAIRNAAVFAVRPPARRKKTEFSSKNGSAGVKQAAYGETRTAMIKKKAYEKQIIS
jgi:hypothetical protein